MCGGEDQDEIACQKRPRAFVCSALCSRAACRCDSPCRERCTQLRCCKDKRSLVASLDKNPHASCPSQRDEPPLAFVQEPSGACMLVDLQLAQRLQEFQVALVLLLQKNKNRKKSVFRDLQRCKVLSREIFPHCLQKCSQVCQGTALGRESCLVNLGLAGMGKILVWVIKTQSPGVAVPYRAPCRRKWI